MNLKQELKNILSENTYIYSGYEKTWIIAFLEPIPDEYLDKMLIDIDNSIDNKKIQINDIPKITIIIAKYYNSEAEKQELFDIDKISFIIKLTIYAILDSNKYIVPPVNQMYNIELIINHSLELLKTRILDKPVKNDSQCCVLWWLN
jgi:hypothetical protein